MTAPVITRADVRALLDSPGEDPVLYLSAGPDDEGGPLQIEQWEAAYVSASKVVARQSDVLEELGEDPDRDALDHYLPMLQETVEETARRL
jgi:hypothetical protein